MARKRTQARAVDATRAHPPTWQELLAQQWLLEAQTRLRLQAAHAERVRDQVSQFQDHVKQRQRWIQKQLVKTEPQQAPTQPRKGKKKSGKGGSLRSNVFRALDALARKGERPSLSVVNERLNKRGFRDLSTLQLQGFMEEWQQMRK